MKSNTLKQQIKNKVPFEVALGSGYLMYRELFNKGKIREFKNEKQDLEKLRFYFQEILNFVEENYVTPRINYPEKKIYWDGKKEIKKLNFGGKEDSLENVLCYISNSDNLPPLPTTGWERFFTHIDMFQNLYGKENFEVYIKIKF